MVETLQNASAGSLVPRLSADARRQVRSHAMRHFRREQRKQIGSANERTSRLKQDNTLLRTLSEATDATGDREANEAQERRNDEVLALTKKGASGNTAPSSWDDSACQYEDIQIRLDPGGAAYYRYTLAEMFGAHLIGSVPQHPRSAPILSYRSYVANVRSDLIQAHEDALGLIIPACTLTDPRILTQVRKSHLFLVRKLRETLESGSYDVDSTVAAAVGLLTLELFKIFSVGAQRLYEGAVNLVRTHMEHLMSSQAPATKFLLMMMRHAMLLMSLSDRSPLPIGSETWEQLHKASSLSSLMIETLMRLAIQLPDLLQTAREVQRNSATSSRPFNQALGDLLSLERQLNQWQNRYCAELPDLLRPSDRTQSFENISFPAENGATEGGGENRNTRFLTAHAQAMCCICLVLLQESVADLIAIIGGNASKNEYVMRVTRTADTLCLLAEYFTQKGDGLLSKALSMRAPLHFARQWYAANGNCEGTKWIDEKVTLAKKEAPFLSWESLLPLSLLSMYMHA